MELEKHYGKLNLDVLSVQNIIGAALRIFFPTFQVGYCA